MPATVRGSVMGAIVSMAFSFVVAGCGDNGVRGEPVHPATATTTAQDAATDTDVLVSGSSQASMAALGGGFVVDPTDTAARPVRVGSVDGPAGCLRYGVFLAGPEREAVAPRTAGP